MLLPCYIFAENHSSVRNSEHVVIFVVVIFRIILPQIFRDKLPRDGLGATSTATKDFWRCKINQKKRCKIFMKVTRLRLWCGIALHLSLNHGRFGVEHRFSLAGRANGSGSQICAQSQ